MQTPARSLSTGHTLLLSGLFFLGLSVVNAVQIQIAQPFIFDGVVETLLYGAKACLFASFALLLYAGTKKTPRDTSAAPLRTPRHSFDPLLILRFLAGYMVVTGHGLEIFHPVSLDDSLKTGGWQWILTSSPSAGMWIFFTLSGYLMGKGFFTQRYHPDWSGTCNFYRNRILRIVPLCWASVFIVSVVSYPAIFLPENWGDLARILFFDYNTRQKLNLISPLWSLTTEMEFYAIVPLLYIAFGRTGASLKKALAIAAVFFAFDFEYRFFSYAFWPHGSYRPLLANMDLFMCGFLTNHVVAIAVRERKNLAKGLSWGFALLLLIYLLPSWVNAKAEILNIHYWRIGYLLFFPAIVSLLTSIVICCFELGAQPAAPGFWLRMAKRMEIFGLLTYAIYVWHFPVFEFVAHRQHADSAGQPWMGSWSDAVQLVGVSFLIILAISTVLYYAVEVPFERKKTYQRS